MIPGLPLPGVAAASKPLAVSGGSGTSHRYWRILGGMAIGSGDNAQYAGVEFLDHAGGSNLATGGTVLKSSEFGSYPATNAFDGDNSTKWAAVGTVSQWIGYDFGSGVQIGAVALTYTNDGFRNQRWGSFFIEWSDDNSTWTTAGLSLDFTAPAASDRREFTVVSPIAGEPGLSKTTPHRYWRLQTLQNNDGAYQVLGSFGLYDASAVDLIAAGYASITDDAHQGGAPAANLLTSSTSDFWADNAECRIRVITLDFGSGNAQTVASYMVGASTPYPTLTPRGFRLQCSDDGTNYRTVDTRLNESGWSAYEQRTYTIPADVISDFDADTIVKYAINFSSDTIIVDGIAGGFVVDTIFPYSIRFRSDTIIIAGVAPLAVFPSTIDDYRIIAPSPNEPHAAARVDTFMPVIDVQVTGTPAPHYHSLVVKPDAVTVGEYLFYSDYYERIWVSPRVRRIANPRIGQPSVFYMWNAFSVANTLNAETNNDLPGVTLDFDIPLPFDRYEIKELTFTITTDAPPSLNGSFDFDFDFGTGRLGIIATIVEILRAIPDVPIREVWAFSTIVNGSHNNNEQRMSLREEPRVQIGFKALILNEVDRRVLYRQLFQFVTRPIRMPLYQYATGLTDDTAIGGTKLFFNPAYTNVRDHDYIALFDQVTETFTIVKLVEVQSDGATLEAPLEQYAGAGLLIVPTIAAKMPDGSGYSMEATHGTIDVKAESTDLLRLRRPGSTAIVETMNGYPLLTVRPTADQPLDEDFAGGNETIDDGSGLPSFYSDWTMPAISGARVFKLDRLRGMDYWREFGHAIRGRWRPFLMPSWRPDVVLAQAPAPGATALVLADYDYAGKWPNNSFRRLYIETAAGFITRRVISIDDTDPAGLVIALDVPLGSSPADADVKRISFLNVVRLTTDNIVIDHVERDSFVTLEMQTVNE